MQEPTVYNVHAAKTGFSRLLARVAKGETIVIARAGKPVAKLIPYVEPVRKRVPGQDAGVVRVAPDFDDPLPGDVLSRFYSVDPDGVD